MAESVRRPGRRLRRCVTAIDVSGTGGEASLASREALDGERCEQSFDAVGVDDAALERFGDAHDLQVVGMFDPDGMLVRLEGAR